MEAFLVGKETVHREPFGGLLSATVIRSQDDSDQKQAAASGLEISPVSLQQLVVHLTNGKSKKRSGCTMNRISSVLTLHYRDKWSWFYIPSIILFSSFAVNLIVSFLVTSQGAFYTGGVTSIFIYLFVAGIIVVTKTFPFAIGMSIRRVDYFTGSVVMGAIVSIVFATLIFLMAQLENQSNWLGK